MHHGLYHFHQRQTGHKISDHSSRWARLMDKTVYAVGMVSPLMTVPQIFAIWGQKTAEGVSATTWAFYLLGALFWMTYGILHKEKPIILANGASAFVIFLVFLGAIIY